MISTSRPMPTGSAPRATRRIDLPMECDMGIETIPDREPDRNANPGHRVVHEAPERMMKGLHEPIQPRVRSTR